MNVADFRLGDLGGASPSADDLAQAQGIADLRQQGFDLVETFAHDVGRAAFGLFAIVQIDPALPESHSKSFYTLRRSEPQLSKLLGWNS